MDYLTMGETAKSWGVSVSTWRRWELEKTFLPSYRTVGGHRRYSWQDIQPFCGQRAPEHRKTVAYARVSSPDQKADLARQAARRERYGTEQGFERVEILKDWGSGLNYQKNHLNNDLEWLLSLRTDAVIAYLFAFQPFLTVSCSQNALISVKCVSPEVRLDISFWRIKTDDFVFGQKLSFNAVSFIKQKWWFEKQKIAWVWKKAS